MNELVRATGMFRPSNNPRSFQTFDPWSFLPMIKTPIKPSSNNVSVNTLTDAQFLDFQEFWEQSQQLQNDNSDDSVGMDVSMYSVHKSELNKVVKGSIIHGWRTNCRSRCRQ
jgi:hypothetical protein